MSFSKNLLIGDDEQGGKLFENLGRRLNLERVWGGVTLQSKKVGVKRSGKACDISKERPSEFGSSKREQKLDTAVERHLE